MGDSTGTWKVKKYMPSTVQIQEMKLFISFDSKGCSENFTVLPKSLITSTWLKLILLPQIFALSRKWQLKWTNTYHQSFPFELLTSRPNSYGEYLTMLVRTCQDNFRLASPYHGLAPASRPPSPLSPLFHWSKSWLITTMLVQVIPHHYSSLPHWCKS